MPSSRSNSCSSSTNSAWRSATRWCRLVDQAQGGQLLQRIRALRRHLALATGLPGAFDSHHRQHETEAARVCGLSARRGNRALGNVSGSRAGHQLGAAIPLRSTASKRASLPSAPRPNGLRPDLQELALTKGYVVVDQTSVLATHLAELVRQFAHELLTRQETKRLLDALAESSAETGRRTGAAPADPGRSAESSAATVARAGLDSRSHHDSRSPAGYRRHEQVAGGAGGSRAPGAWAVRSCSRCWARTAN